MAMPIGISLSRMITNHACAACRMQRKRCSKDCLLAPHFPSTDPQKFEILQRVYGTNHVIKILQDIPSEKRGDAVNSMVYEATARLKDPVHGCASGVQWLQKRIEELESQLATTQRYVDTVREKYEQLESFIFTRYENDELYVYKCLPWEHNQEDLILDDMDSFRLW